MYLENIVIDALGPRELGRFWEAALGSERLTDEPDGFETRVAVEGGPTLDLCLQRVPEASGEVSRLVLTVSGARHDVDSLVVLGARRSSVDPGDGSWVQLADPEGNPFRVASEEPVSSDDGSVMAIALASADPDRDGQFWSWLTGWAVAAERSLRHPSSRGPILRLAPEHTRKAAAKNRMHLDLRLEPDDDAATVAAEIAQRGGRELHPDWGTLPWQVFADPSGNEFCVLPHRP